MSKRRSFFQIASLKHTLSAIADRYALPLSLLIFLPAYAADRYFPGDISFAPFYCAVIAVLAWYRNAPLAYLAAVIAVLAASHNTSGPVNGAADLYYLALRSLSDLVLFAGFSFVTLQARSHFNRMKLSVDSLERLAFHDLLTGLPNRPLLYDRLAIAISQARRNQSKVALLLLDLDGFKIVNDRHGHRAGDEVLKTVASRILACVRGVDTVARLGGDEFAIVMADISDPRDAGNVAEKVLSSIAAPIVAREGGVYQVGISIGISVFPEHGNEIDKLLSGADAAMYRSKRGGKNKYTFFSLPAASDAQSPWIEFNRSLETGFAEIDHQHRQLFALAGHLNQAIIAGEPPEIVKRKFNELMLYARFHFSTEERLMEQYGYPVQDDHRQSHLDLLESIDHIRTRLKQGSELISLQTLKDWLLEHIEHSDKLLGAYLSDHPSEDPQEPAGRRQP